MQPSGSTQQQAYEYLQDGIVSGVLSGGTRLKPSLIAAELGISRVPVREAIFQLNAEGYVTIRPNRGAVVTSRSPDEVLELFEIRAALEGLALRFAAARVTLEMLADLELELQRLRRVGANHASWLERHDDFHEALCLASGQRQLASECRRYRLAVRPYVCLYLKSGKSFEQPGFEHEYLLQALGEADGDEVERACRAHVRANAEAIAACLPDPASASSASAA